MQVSKWGNSLAVRLPAAVVDALGLKEGDQVEVQIAGKQAFQVAKAPGTRELLARLRRIRSLTRVYCFICCRTTRSRRTESNNYSQNGAQ
jgi:antitoxin MazE